MVWSILLYKSFEKIFIWGWIWFESFCFTNPLRKASLEAEAGLKHLALQILWERLHLRPDLVWSIFLYKSLKKGFIWANVIGTRFCIGLTSLCSQTITSYGDQLLRILQMRQHFKFGLVQLRRTSSQMRHPVLHVRWTLCYWITPLTRTPYCVQAFKKSFIWGWIWFEASCFPDPSRKAPFEAEVGLKFVWAQT